MGEITLRKALDDYKTVYMAYRNFAERTREEYLNDLEDFVEFLEKAGLANVKKVNLPIIERYVASLEQNGLASPTRKRRVVAIRSFLSFLYLDDYIDTDIAKKIVLPFIESTTPNFLTQTECNQVRLACASSPRDRAIIELILQTGIKLSELIDLTVNDIQLDEKDSGFVRVLGGRAKKERVIPLNKKAYDALKDYLDERKDSGNSIFFLSRFGETLGERGVQKMLRKYLKRAGIGNASIHTLRHTFGVQHLVKGTNPRTVQEVMGLKDVRSTLVYQSLAKEVVKKELQNNAI